MINLIVLLCAYCLVIFITIRLTFKKENMLDLYLIACVSMTLQVVVANQVTVHRFLSPELLYILYVFITVALSMQMIFFLLQSFIKLISKVKQEKIIGKLLVNLVFLLIVPNVSFGFIYMFWDVSHNISFLDFVYFAFAINYSLPLVSDTYNEMLEAINSNSVFKIVQMTHIVAAKITELVVLGFIVSRIHDSLSNKTKKR